MPLIHMRVHTEGPPSAIVIQLGENDLPATDCLTLRSIIQKDLQDLASYWPTVKMFWSQLLQRHVWRGSHSPAATEKARKRTNSATIKVIQGLGGFVITHPDINVKASHMYRDDGVHLSSLGSDTWLNSVASGLKAWVE